MQKIRPVMYVAALALLGATWAAPVGAHDMKGQTYHFGTHPARTAITFVSEADLETIHGVTNAIGGSLRVDKEGKKASGVLTLPVASMKTGIDLRDEHLRSAQWLDAAKYPEIRLELVEAALDEKAKVWRYDAKITIKGVTKAFKGTARVRAYDEAITKALGAGSWMRVRTAFKITLSDFGIEIPQMVGAKVSKTWDIGVDIYGTTAVPKKRG